jgi:hypothetical protein
LKAGALFALNCEKVAVWQIKQLRSDFLDQAREGALMRHICVKFMAAVAVVAAGFAGCVLYQTWYETRLQMETLTEQEAALALEFDLAQVRQLST